MTFVLSFYGDGPKWENLVYIPAYPSGCSYFRPFRYRDEWIEPALLGRLRASESALNNSDLFVCARFRPATDAATVLLPIRKAKLTRFRYSEGDHSIYFSLGQLVDLRGGKTLREGALEIPSTEQDRIGTSFFFETALTFDQALFASEENERGAWTALADRLARDETLPISSEVRRSVFLRIQWPVKGSKASKAKRLEHSYGEGPRFGFKIGEGGRYEFELAHRFPEFIGSDDRMPPFLLSIGKETDNLQVSPTDEEVSGNYQTHFFRVTGVSASKTAEQIILDPSTESLAIEGKDSSPIPRLKVPVRVPLEPVVPGEDQLGLVLCHARRTASKQLGDLHSRQECRT
jgi:hypothetical protein